MNKLDQLRKMTTVVADTGDIESIQQYTPTDATTNPSLLFKAAQMPQYQHLVQDAIKYGTKSASDPNQQITLTLDKIAINFGEEILKIIPGRVSTEVDARLSFDTNATVRRAKRLIEMYRDQGIPTVRVLIKIASTWEGIRAAQQLEAEGIHCNLTLMFSLIQAIAAAEAGATLVSPFVGRILDWHKKANGVTSFPANEDPGVMSVTTIYNYYKKFGHATSVMGASFRNKDEILELAGCDLLTIAPALMEELRTSEGHLERKLDIGTAKHSNIQRQHINEGVFRWQLNQDAMATEKLAEGIRGFTADTVKLENLIQQQANTRVA